MIAPLGRPGSRTRTLLGMARLITRDLGGMYRSAGPKVAARYVVEGFAHGIEVVRFRSLVPVDQAMPRRSYRLCPVDGRGVLEVDTRIDCGASEVFSGIREMYCRKVYVGQPGFEILPSDNVVDLGANIGLFATMAAVYGQRVVAVEAQSGFLPFIRDNLRRNGVEAKVAVHLGLVAGGTGVLAGEKPQASHWGDRPPATDVAQLIQIYELETIDFLKIDIEGSEYDLFGVAGDSKDLSWLAQVVRIAKEVHTKYGDPAKITRILSEQGFRTWLTTNAGRGTDLVDEPTGFLFAIRPT